MEDDAAVRGCIVVVEQIRFFLHVTNIMIGGELVSINAAQSGKLKEGLSLTNFADLVRRLKYLLCTFHSYNTLLALRMRFG